MYLSRIIILLLAVSTLNAETYICKGSKTLAVIETYEDNSISVNINGIQYEGKWKGTSQDRTIKLHYLYGPDNIWIHSYKNNFTNATIRFHSDFDNMRIVQIDCKAKS